MTTGIGVTAGTGVTTRALVARGDGTAPDLVTVELLPLGERDVLVELAAAAVCRTELMTVDRALAGHERPSGTDARLTVLGHAATGTVTSVGSAVTRVAPGDRVVVTGTRQCGSCFYCLKDAPGACDEIFTHMERRVGTSTTGEAVWSDGGMGTHAERMVFVESNLVRVEGLAPARELALLGCGVTSGAGAVREVARVREGQSVAVSGCGHLGLWMLRTAALAGAHPLIAIEPDPWRRERARQAGATHVIDPRLDSQRPFDLTAAVRDLTDGRGADVALEAAGTTLALRQSFELSRLGAVVVPTGLESETAVVCLDNLQYSLGSRTIRGAQCGGGDVLRIVPEYERLLASGALRADLVITSEHTLADAAEAYELLSDPRSLTAIILLADADADADADANADADADTDPAAHAADPAADVADPADADAHAEANPDADSHTDTRAHPTPPREEPAS
ncbi:zinc-binding dehydrogenase [Herbiconiux sp. KACC 21604]|uniref:zinc-binding dehydrogenase n=1 Tax=Herbiconiux sp. KACC 21604 TaxID=3092664 RepID=UPI00388FACCC|nr:zinc-binding dehydrogenase [Herbiconiux sp. KACC 21604]